MNYRTTCPHCASVFRLGADQLDAAQGWVQCSVCGAAFDARPSLLLEDGSPLPAAAEPGPAEASPPPETIAAAAAEPAAVSETAATAETTETAPGTEDAAATDIPRGIGQREATLDLDSIILIDPEIPLPDDPGPLPQFHTAPAYPPAAVPAAPATRIEYAAPLLDRPHLPPPPRRIRPWAWAVAGALLLVLLLAQTAYFLRDTLVSHLPQARPAFEQACAVLGCTLSLPKNLALLQIVGSDLQTEAPARGTPAGDPLLRSDPSAASGRLKLTLTLGNRANHVQAWPVLVLTLTDQRNRALARRSFAPSEYLGDARRIAAGLPPHSEQALSLPLTVRDLAPMGFDLQLAY
ncbi:zinc-ribbon and DUF3426 domain-containing protein [Thiobacillus sp.]|uniref:zinc-ribbon and DUF3426 domain-containing protein n=1 Tax=Thiobacillus sp. TaxID=924 RepID=UPI0025CDC2B3|nr:zinc-ribbon and DUF3426 domain-containing protein [Thiobacillus sp.]